MSVVLSFFFSLLSKSCIKLHIFVLEPRFCHLLIENIINISEDSCLPRPACEVELSSSEFSKNIYVHV